MRMKIKNDFLKGVIGTWVLLIGVAGIVAIMVGVRALFEIHWLLGAFMGTSVLSVFVGLFLMFVKSDIGEKNERR